LKISYIEELMGGKVGGAPACYGSSLGPNPDISQKYKTARHKRRSGQHSLARQKIHKNYTKKSAASTEKYAW
jgi:hypothetical protein